MTTEYTTRMGDVEGDVHDIASTMLQSAGFEVHDIGIDVPLFQDFIDKIKETNADMVSLSALTTTTLPGQKKVIGMLKEQGLRDKVKVMVGGAPATETWAKKISAGCYMQKMQVKPWQKPKNYFSEICGR